MAIRDQLTALESSGLIRLAQVEPEAEYVFRHVLLREATYEAVLKQERRRLHLAVAEAMTRLYPNRTNTRELVSLLAEHHWRADDFPKAADYSIDAGDSAARVYALREAMGHYERAIQALDKSIDANPQKRFDAIMRWVQVAQRYTPYAEQLERLMRAEAIARELGDKKRLAQALHWIGATHRAQGYNVRAIPALIECFHLVDELDDERLVITPTYYMALVTMDSDPQAALSLFERAIGLARKHGNRDVEAYALSTRAMLEARMGEFARSRRNMALAAQVIAETGSPMTQSDVTLYSAWSYLDIGDVERARERARLGVEQALAADNMDCVCYGFACVGFGNLRAQLLPEATRAFEEAIRRSQFSGAAQVENLGRFGLAITRLSTGHPEALEEMEQALLQARSLGDQMATAMISQTLGEVLSAMGQVEHAGAYLTDALEYYRRTNARPYLSRTLKSMAVLYESQGRMADAANVRTQIDSLTNELTDAVAS
jgi:tetratricopeptide (TPR) repeat protein